MTTRLRSLAPNSVVTTHADAGRSARPLAATTGRLQASALWSATRSPTNARRTAGHEHPTAAGPGDRQAHRGPGQDGGRDLHPRLREGGEVVAVGKGRVLDDGRVRPLDVKPGDRVLFAKFAGTAGEVCLLKSPSADPCATRGGSTCAPA